MKNKYYLLLLLFIAFCFIANAQDFEWLNSYGNRQFEFSGNVMVQNDKSCYLIVNHSSVLNNVDDTIDFGKSRVLLPFVKKSYNTSFLLKIKRNTSNISSFIQLPGFYASDLTSDSAGALYLSGDFKDSISVNSKTYYAKKGAILLLKYDSALNLSVVKQIGNDTSKSLKIIHKKNKLYFCIKASGNVPIGDSILNCAKYNSLLQNYSIIVGKIDDNLGKLNWVKTLYNNISGNSLDIQNITTLGNNLVLSSNVSLYGNNWNLKLGSDTLTNKGTCIILDSVGNYNSMFQVGLEVNAISANDSILVLSGSFEDSIHWGGIDYKSGFSTQSNQRNFFVAAKSI